jgi:UDP-N-acetylmuramoylalanine--D-glutamate ligase
MKILKNQDKDDYIVLNYDDKILRQLKDNLKANLIWFSVSDILDKGVYIENDYIVINDGNRIIPFMLYRDLKIIGKHNLENVLGCIGIALAMKLDLEIVKEVLLNFNGVEHRIEFVARKRGITFYNDSKGTNPDASIKAIEAVKEPIILIAGGYDKGSTYDAFIDAFNDKVKTLILFGQTRDLIKSAALKNGFTKVFLVNDLKEAINLSYSIGDENDNVLLSPACASWDMYKNFEERGSDFKNIVFSLME